MNSLFICLGICTLLACFVGCVVKEEDYHHHYHHHHDKVYIEEPAVIEVR